MSAAEKSTSQHLRVPKEWIPRRIIERYPVYSDHWLPSRRNGELAWNIARFINDAAGTIASGAVASFSEGLARLMATDCNATEVFRALDEYPQDRPEVRAVRVFFERIGDVICMGCGISFCFQTAHRCSPDLIRKRRQQNAPLVKDVKRTFRRK